jgi:hypothetical protein
LNTGRRDGKTSTDRPSYGTAIYVLLSFGDFSITTTTIVIINFKA